MYREISPILEPAHRGDTSDLELFVADAIADLSTSDSIEADAAAADDDLRRRVSAFLAGRNVPGLRRLDVLSRGGIVTLRGRVRTFYEKQLGASAAQRVAGVVRVIDDVLVAPAESFSNPNSLDKSSGRGLSLARTAGSRRPQRNRHRGDSR